MFEKADVLRFLEVLDGLKSYMKLVGVISTTPGTYKSPWCRVMTKKILNKLLQTSDHHFEAPNEYVLDLLSIEENMEVSTFLILECSAFLAILLTNASIWQNLNKESVNIAHCFQ